MFKRGDPSTVFLLLAVGLLLLGGVYLSILSSSGNDITGAAGQTTESCSTCMVCTAQPGICISLFVLVTCIAGIVVIEFTRS
ncbi:hypothetical protein GF342_04020 [Candidatus Woesearchaeota archaeon]|nr:hypothetical protein [Candidatus Woesearchaeota archaeon]